MATVIIAAMHHLPHNVTPVTLMHDHLQADAQLYLLEPSSHTNVDCCKKLPCGRVSVRHHTHVPVGQAATASCRHTSDSHCDLERHGSEGDTQTVEEVPPPSELEFRCRPRPAPRVQVDAGGNGAVVHLHLRLVLTRPCDTDCLV
jgi:hypothetical protein